MKWALSALLTYYGFVGNMTLFLSYEIQADNTFTKIQQHGERVGVGWPKIFFEPEPTIVLHPLGSRMSRSSDSSRFMYDMRKKGCKYISLERKDPESKSKSKIPQTGVGDPSKKSYLGDPLFDKVWDYWGFLDRERRMNVHDLTFRYLPEYQEK